MINLEQLDNEITKQTRNGRTDIYLNIQTLNELGYNFTSDQEERQFVDLTDLKIKIERYKFRQDLKSMSNTANKVNNHLDEIISNLNVTKTKEEKKLNKK